MNFKRCTHGNRDCIVLYDIDSDAVIMYREDYPEFKKFIEEKTDWSK